MITARRRVAVALATVAVLGGAAACVPAVTTATPEPGPPPVTARAGTLPAGASAMGQTDGEVWALAVSDGKVYAGGDFLNVFPSGGGTAQPATRIAAFDAATGAPISSFSHRISGHVSSLAVSPDGTRLYVGGQFTKVDNEDRGRIASFDLTQPNTPLTDYNPIVSSTSGVPDVRAIAVAPDGSVVFGGQFTHVGGIIPQPNLAKTDVAGTIQPWAPTVDGPVNAVTIPAGGPNVVFGGNFNTVNTEHHRALASVQLGNGSENGPMAAVIPDCVGNPCTKPRSDVKSLASVGTTVYLGAEGTGGGWFDGTAAVNSSTGAQLWKDNCLGATQAVAVVGSALYVGSHAHDCSAIGGFGQAPFQTGANSWHHLLAEQTSNGALLDWFPNTNPGPTNGAAANELGPRVMASDGTNLFVGGQFTQVNGQAQRGVARFTPTGARAKPVRVTNAVVSTLSGGQAEIRFSGAADLDSGVLTYRVYRDGNYGTPVKTFSNVWSRFWQAPLLALRDTPGSGSHFYEIDAVDESGQATRSARFSPTANSTGYYNAVRTGGPSLYWRLGETGATAMDSSGRNVSGTYGGSLNRGIAGAIPSDKALHLGSTGVVASNGAVAPAPNTYTAEVWIRTTTKTGGRIWGFGNSQTDASTRYDRLLYMTNSGQLIFGVWNAGAKYTWSPKSYNDGYWHHVVATQGSDGLRLFVDGQQVSTNPVTTGQVYSGWWRVGNDAFTGWPQQPASTGFNGDVDEFAVYPKVLTVATTRPHVSAE